MAPPALYCLTRLSTPDMPDTRGLDDALLPLYYALRSLGFEAEMRVNSFNPKARNICLGANYDPRGRWHQIPENSIVLNLEQLTAKGYPWQKRDEYFQLLTAHEVWDFSRLNVDFLATKNIKASFLPLGYVPEMTRLTTCPNPAWDVLFYGAMTPRRRQVLEDLTSHGVQVHRLDQAYGQRRDQALYSSRIFLNIHHSLPASLEVVRLGYVWANSKAVVSERAPDTDFYPELSQACAFAPYEKLTDTVLELLYDVKRQKCQAEQGYESFKALRLDAALTAILGTESQPGSKITTTFPKKSKPKHLRVGSGIDFINQALNVDTDPRYRPDLVLDLSQWEPGSRHHTDRFGEIYLEPGSFEIISAPHVLDRSPQPDRLMEVFLELLEEGGHLILTLPCSPEPELFGHSVFFSEKFIQRYTTYAYLRGYTKYRFEQESLEYEYSDLGRILQGQGCSLEKIRRTPGAIVRMRAVLVKRALAPGELAEALCWGRDYYLGVAELWQVEDEDDSPTILTDSLPAPRGLSRSKLFTEFCRQTLNLCRYRINLRFGLGKGHGRYPDKVLATRKRIQRLRELMKLRP